MREVTQTLALERYEVMRTGETTMVQIVPQMISSLRLELTFWETSAGKIEYSLVNLIQSQETFLQNL